MYKIILALAAAACLCGCGLYGTTQYTNTVDLTRADFSRPQDLKTASSCTFLVLGFIPWPWADHTPDTLLQAIEQSGMQKVQLVDKTYDYRFTHARSCTNAYGY